MTTSTLTTSTLTPVGNERSTHDFGGRASKETIERTAESLRAKGYAVHVVEDGVEARRLILDLLPDGAEVGQGASTTPRGHWGH